MVNFFNSLHFISQSINPSQDMISLYYQRYGSSCFDGFSVLSFPYSKSQPDVKISIKAMTKINIALIFYTSCGQKNSIQDGYMLSGGFTKYLCFGELMENSGLNKRYND